MVVARYTAAGVYNASAVCYAPHLIDYTARAVAVRPNGIDRARGLRPRSPSVGGRPADRPGRPVRPARDRHAAGERQQHDRLRHVLRHAPARQPLARLERRQGRRRSRPTAPCTDASLGGRFYDAVVALPGQPLRRSRRSTAPTAPPGCSATRRPSAIDGGFGGGRVALGDLAVHALALLGDGAMLAAGESIDAAVSANRQMQVARIGTNGALVPGYGTGGIARSRVGGGTDTGQAIVVQADGSAIVGGAANIAGKSAFALTRLSRRQACATTRSGCTARRRRRSARRPSTATSPAWRSRATCSRWRDA